MSYSNKKINNLATQWAYDEWWWPNLPLLSKDEIEYYARDYIGNSRLDIDYAGLRWNFGGTWNRDRDDTEFNPDTVKRVVDALAMFTLYTGSRSDYHRWTANGRWHSSYGLKHRMEDLFRTHFNEEYSYVSNGEFIVAYLYLMSQHFQCPYTQKSIGSMIRFNAFDINAYIRMPRIFENVADRWLFGGTN